MENETPSQKSINWKKVLIGVAVAILLIGGGVVVWMLLGNPSTSLPSNVPTATSSPQTSTPSAQVGETAGWKTLVTKPTTYNNTIKFSFKYPPDFRIINDEGYEVATNEPNYSLGISTAGSISVIARLSPSAEKPSPSTETTLGGKKALRGQKIANKSGNVTYYIQSVTTNEGESVPFVFICYFIPKDGVEAEKTCDTIASTFKFLD